MRYTLVSVALLLGLLTGLAWGYATHLKDPEAVLDYRADWSKWLAKADPNDTIVSSSWSVPSGITQDSASFTTTTTTIWLSGGTAGRSYDVRNRITTAGGRVDDRTIRINVQER